MTNEAAAIQVEWSAGVLSDIVDVNPDKASAISNLKHFRYVDISCLSEDGLRPAIDIPEVSKDDAPSRAQRLLRTGDSLVGTVRPERRARGCVPDELDGEVASSGICVLRPKTASDSRFVYAVIQSDDFTEWCVARETGTSYPSVSSADIASFPLLLPPEEERTRIGEVLAAIDAKFEMCQTVKRTVMDEAGALVASLANSETARSVRVGEVIERLDKGVSYKGSGLTDSGTWLVNLANFTPRGEFNQDGLKFYSGATRPQHLVQEGDLVVANTDLTQDRVILGQPAIIPPGSHTAAITHHVYAARFKPAMEAYRLPIYFALREQEFRDRVYNHGTGTTVSGLSRDSILDHVVLLPVEGIEALANHLAERMSLIWALEAEARSLSELKKFLLPRLLSGELQVREETPVEEAS